ncbi:FtsX-like permease family protein [Micromonospora inositola]|uniref:FtsX-like permease family protein n=1 Tax=Micromonospora inositola TaxID=47865 RepID=A0A1C5GM48_9ACTN|nr:FtsX-like permease family protein [Micromonospora inositola]SCG34878.1 FtsX-like permease family protein [Micromonospora inositola]
MKLVWRRAVEARGLLLAAAVAALVAVALVTGLSDYNRRAVEAGQRALLAGAPLEERSILVSGSGGKDAAELAARDRALRAGFAAGLGGAPVTVTGARYGGGRELTGDLGPRVRTDDDPIFANLATLDDLPAHAELASGAWPSAGAKPLQVTLPEKVAGALGMTVGERVPMLDRSTERASEVVLVGTWRPRDPAEPYWRLAPGVGTDAAATSDTSYGPFVLDAADFAATFPRSVSAWWVVEPDLTAAARNGRLLDVRQAFTDAVTQVPEAAGLGSSVQVVTAMDRLLSRIARADLVGRSALATPVLLIVVLGGYALVLVAALLHEDRRNQTALLRARGAARRQLAGLAAREATLVVLPAAVLGPLLAGEALRHVGGNPTGPALTAGSPTLLWAAALVTAAGCLVAMVAPTLRGAGTYVADLAARSRPDRSATLQRASLDLVLVAFAVLAWTQLRQYSSPVTGAAGRLGVDPLLVAAPTLGVLAGAVVALRLLPPATRFAERFVDRKLWTATIFGMWQAGRRPHAGPVLLLALAVGGSTLAWSLVATGERSLVDQANHAVGADLRLTERDGVAPVGRAAELRALPGAERALPAWRDEIRVGRSDLPATVVSLDVAAAAQVVRLDDRLADEPVPALFDRLVRARSAPAGVELPADTRSITGTVRTPVRDAVSPHQIAVSMLLTRADGLAFRLPVASTGSDGRPAPFTVKLPEAGPLRLAGFEADGGDVAGTAYRLEVTDLRLVGADGAAQPARLGDGWLATNGEPTGKLTVSATATGLSAENEVTFLPGGQFAYQESSRFVVVPAGDNRSVPALMTPRVREALSLRTGDTVTLSLSGVSLPVMLIGEMAAVPATTGEGVLLDLPAATDWLIRDRGTVRPVQEWWLGTDDGGHAAAARAAADLHGATVLDRRELAERAAEDPYWRGARTGLLAAALGAVLLALVGLIVDVWATARHRLGEFAVLHTLGAAPRLLTRALLAEQTFLAGLGVGVGLLLGAAVGVTMAPLVILTPSASRPVPEAAFVLPWAPIGLTALGLLLAALAFSAFIALGIRQRVAAAQLRIGGDR